MSEDEEQVKFMVIHIEGTQVGFMCKQTHARLDLHSIKSNAKAAMSPEYMLEMHFSANHGYV